MGCLPAPRRERAAELQDSLEALALIGVVENIEKRRIQLVALEFAIGQLAQRDVINVPGHRSSSNRAGVK